MEPNCWTRLSLATLPLFVHHQGKVAAAVEVEEGGAVQEETGHRGVARRVWQPPNRRMFPGVRMIGIKGPYDDW